MFNFRVKTVNVHYENERRRQLKLCDKRRRRDAEIKKLRRRQRAKHARR